MNALQDSNTFLYFGDKNVSKVSGIWKALHISIYIAVAVNAFVTAMAAGNMFQTFKYNCILFCTDVAFENEIQADSPLVHLLTPRDASFPESDETSDINRTLVETIVRQTFDNNNFDNATTEGNTTDLENDVSISINKSNAIISTTDESKKDNQAIIFKNQSHIFRIEDDSIAITYAILDVRKTVFPSNFWCNFVLGIALVTFIFAAFCVVLLAMCSKGGKGQNNTLNRPQNMIYPILVSSILLGILNLVASVVVKNGTEAFCAKFEIFTGEKSCSPFLNKFTIHERQQNFYLPYLVLSHTFNLTVIFFLGQVAITCLRVIYAVDYQLYALKVEDDEEDTHDFEVEDGHIVKERRLTSSPL